MKIDPRHLEILAAIVEQGGLTEGATALGKSQPSVSRSLALLEQRVGQPLFIPRKRPLQATELGLSLAQQGQKILEAGRAASTVADAFNRGYAGAIRLAGTPIFMDGVISSIIAEFQVAHPNVSIEQSYAYQAEAMERIANNVLDLAILPVRPADLSKEFTFQQLIKGRNVIACRANHPLLDDPSLNPEKLVDYPWIVPPANSPLFKDLRTLLDKTGSRNLKIGFTGGSLSAVVNVLLGSDSLTVLPFSVLHLQKRQNPLAALPIEIGDPGRHPGIISSKSIKMHRAASRFSDFVRNKFEIIKGQLTASQPF